MQIFIGSLNHLIEQDYSLPECITACSNKALAYNNKILIKNKDMKIDSNSDLNECKRGLSLKNLLNLNVK